MDCMEALRYHIWLCNNYKFSQWWTMLWFPLVWSLLLMRNEVVFDKKESSVVQLLHSIKIRSWL
ncbi:unnamed protein product [Lupinus luteus]|uniref:Uncharacterized protein n=1 Tax=Lupinus luteus TaxID=3873 RepID=A0AAV1Y5E0_LUPLU